MSAAAIHLLAAVRHSRHASPATRARVERAIQLYRDLLAFRSRVGIS